MKKCRRLGAFLGTALMITLAAMPAMVSSCGKPEEENQETDNQDKDSDKPDEETTVTYGTPKHTSKGWDIYVAGSYRYGPSFIINDDGSIDAWFAAPGGHHGGSRANYDTSISDHTPYQVKNGNAAQYFKCDNDFYSVQICCPTWGSTEECMTFKLYKWDGSYEKTVEGTPVYSKRFEKFQDNGWLPLYINDDAETTHEKIPAGEYLWVASEPTNTAGIWVCDKSASSPGNMSPRSYKNGVLISDIQFQSRVLDEYSTGALYWDQISYQHSGDGGKTWTTEVNTLIPTEFSEDALSCCDPGVAKWGGYYYLGYTSTEDQGGIDNNVFVARSKNPDGPWEKWNGTGWGGNPKPVIQYHGVGNPKNWGAGEPCFVVVDNTVYFYYSWNDPGSTTRVSTASASDENWPAHLESKGTAIDKSDASYQSADHSDVKYRPDLKKFYAINTAKRMTKNAFLQIWTSDDGLKFTLEGKMKGSGFKGGLHNCGWSGDALGHQDPTKPQYLGYAYGLDASGNSSWGKWSTWFSILEFPKE